MEKTWETMVNGPVNDISANIHIQIFHFHHIHLVNCPISNSGYLPWLTQCPLRSGAGEDARRRGGEGEEEGAESFLKSNNLHLAGGEK